MGGIGASEQRAAGFNSMPASHRLGSAGRQLSREPVAKQSERQVGTIGECAAHSLGQPGCRCSQPLSAPGPRVLSVSPASATPPPALCKASSSLPSGLPSAGTQALLEPALPLVCSDPG